MIPTDEIINRLKVELSVKDITLGELVEIAEEEGAPLSTIVVAEAVVEENRDYDEILTLALEAFEHNTKAMETGLTKGRSFLLRTVGSDLARYEDRVLIDDSLINNALINTLATEVGNHVKGLQPCAGTGDSCPYQDN
jgi:L-serine dehydratase